MQEYIIDKGLRTKEVGVIFSLSFIISVLLKANGVSDFILDKIIEALSLLKIEQVIDTLGIVPDFVSVPFWFALLSWFYGSCLWKTPVFKKLHNVPDLNGKWTGFLESSYDKSQKYKMDLIVNQTWRKIHFTAVFDKSTSESNVVAILTEKTGRPTIYFGYENESHDIHAHQQMYIGYNKIEFTVDGKLRGRYSNDRPSNSINKSDGNCGVFLLEKVEN